MKIQLWVAGAAILIAVPWGPAVKLLRLIRSSRVVGEGHAGVGLFPPSVDLKLAAAGSHLADGCLTISASSLLQTGDYPSTATVSKEEPVIEGALFLPNRLFLPVLVAYRQRPRVKPEDKPLGLAVSTVLSSQSNSS